MFLRNLCSILLGVILHFAFLLFSGSILPEPCAPGTFQPLPSQGICLSCTEGMYCNGTSSIEPVNCTVGHKCPEGMFIVLCCIRISFTQIAGLNKL